MTLDNFSVRNATTWVDFGSSASNIVTFKNIADLEANLTFTASGTSDVRYGNRVIWTTTDPTSTSTPGFAGDIRQIATTPASGSFRWVATTSSTTAATWIPLQSVETTKTVTTATYTALAGDRYVFCNRTGTINVTLYATPYTGQRIEIKDISGAAGIVTNNITVTGTIDGAATQVIDSNYGELSLVYNGTGWSIV